MKVSKLFPPKPEPVTDVYPFSRKHTSQVTTAEALAITTRGNSYADRTECQYCGGRAVTRSPYLCAACAGY